MQILCFHNPGEENGFLSNWYLSRFIVNDISFSSMEQFMMYKKAVCFRDANIAAQILESEDVSQIKSLGRLVAGYDDNLWNGIRQIVVYQGLFEKFPHSFVPKNIPFVPNLCQPACFSRLIYYN